MKKSTLPIHRWGAGYYSVNSQGEVTVSPRADATALVLADLIDDLRQKDCRFPLILRFLDILEHRVHVLHQAFATAKQQYDYQGEYTSIYPIKVNQQRSVVQALAGHHQYSMGLEAGSKAELLAILAVAAATRHSLTLVLNGYKDAQTIQMALKAQQAGQPLFIVVEKLTELALILSEAKKLGVTPSLGIRVRLASISQGQWQNTGGEKGKFGLSPLQLIDALDALKKHNALACFQMLHFHMGSQIANIWDLQKGLLEGIHFYREAVEYGADHLTIIDVGGGLGVDYEGSQSRHLCSMNYSIEEYANNIIRTFKEKCTEFNLKCPNILTEAGRAMTAHHALLVTDVIQHEDKPRVIDKPVTTNALPPLLQEMWENYQHQDRNIIEIYHNAIFHYQESQTLFTHGQLSLQHRAQAEQLYWATLELCQQQLDVEIQHERDLLQKLNEKLADKLVCNFSIFQSLPDVWAFNQLFPIMPLTRANQHTTKPALIHDMTCDSDGRIDHYINNKSIGSTLQLPAYDPNNPYWLGFFLLGAYQETLGDIHNLFGDPQTVDICMQDNDYTIKQITQGDTVSGVLAQVGFNADDLLAMLMQKFNENDREFFTQILAQHCYLQ